MDQDNSIAALRSRMSELVEQEAVLLAQAFDLSRSGGEGARVDALFARVQAIQVERNDLKKRVGNILGTHRLHAASEVWRPGAYDYREEVGGESQRVRITRGPLGLQVLFPDQRSAVRIEALEGTFDGPLAVDDAASHGDGLQPSVADGPNGKPRARRRPPAKKDS